VSCRLASGADVMLYRVASGTDEVSCKLASGADVMLCRVQVVLMRCRVGWQVVLT